MSWFEKRSSTHFNRNESGRVTSVVRDGVETRAGEKTSDQLLKEYHRKNPSRWNSLKRSMNEHATDRMILGAKEKEARRRGYERGRVSRAESMGFASGRGPIAFQQPKTKVVHVYHKQKKSKHHHPPKKQRPLHFDMWTGQWR